MTQTWIEYAVRYTAPAPFTGIVAHKRREREIAELMAANENSDIQRQGIRCEVVQRTVTATDWTAAE